MRHRAGESVSEIMRDYSLPRAAVLAAINSTPDDNRMTPKEIRESDEYTRQVLEEMERSPREG